MEVDNIASNTSNDQKVRNICTECFEAFGGHLHVRQGSGKATESCVDKGLRKDDATLTLNLFGNWILGVANSGNDKKKKRIIMEFNAFVRTNNKKP